MASVAVADASDDMLSTLFLSILGCLHQLLTSVFLACSPIKHRQSKSTCTRFLRNIIFEDEKAFRRKEAKVKKNMQKTKGILESSGNILNEVQFVVG